MSDEETRWKWNKFMEIGNAIHKMRGQVRIQQAKAAVKFSNSLIEKEYITDSKERYEIYETLLPKIAEYLDGNTEVENTFYFNTARQVFTKVSLILHFLQRRAESKPDSLVMSTMELSLFDITSRRINTDQQKTM